MIGLGLGLSIGHNGGIPLGPLAMAEFLMDFVGGDYRSGTQRSTNVADITGYSFAGKVGESYDYARDGSPLLIPSGSPALVPGVGYLARQALTNLSIYSHTTSTADWSVSNTSKVSGYAGLLSNDAALFTSNGAAGVSHFDTSPSATFASGTVYTIRRLWKPVVGSRIQLTASAAGFGTSVFANFSTAGGGSVTYTSNCTARIYPEASGWYVIEITATATASGSGAGTVLAAITADASGRLEFNASTDSWLTEGAGIYAGTFASLPEIVTDSGSASITLSDMRFVPPASLVAGADGVLVATVDLKALSGVYERLVTITNGTTSERISMARFPTGEIRNVIASGGSSAGASTGLYQLTTGRLTQAIRRQDGKYRASAKTAEGSYAVGSDLTFAAPTGLNRIDVGNQLGVDLVNSPVRNIIWLPGTFSDDQLRAIVEAAWNL